MLSQIFFREDKNIWPLTSRFVTLTVLAMRRVKELQRQVSPLRQAERRHSSASASLASEKESLRKEVENWKKRVTSLTASFNAVSFCCLCESLVFGSGIEIERHCSVARVWVDV